MSSSKTTKTKTTRASATKHTGNPAAEGMRAVRADARVIAAIEKSIATASVVELHGDDAFTRSSLHAFATSIDALGAHYGTYHGAKFSVCIVSEIKWHELSCVELGELALHGKDLTTKTCAVEQLVSRAIAKR